MTVGEFAKAAEDNIELMVLDGEDTLIKFDSEYADNVAESVLNLEVTSFTVVGMIYINGGMVKLQTAAGDESEDDTTDDESVDGTDSDTED